MFFKVILLLISELILVNGTVTRLYFIEGDVKVIIPCRIDMEILRENGVHVSWLFQRMHYQANLAIVSSRAKSNGPPLHDFYCICYSKICLNYFCIYPFLSSGNTKNLFAC
jgi:hypothetical protein